MPTINQKFGFDARGANRSLKNLADNLNNAAGALDKFGDAAKRNNADKLGGKIDDARDKTDKLTVSWKTLARVVATQLAVRALNGIISQLGEAIERARELGLAIAEIKSISGGDLGLDTQGLQDQVIALSSSLGQDAAQVAEGVYQTLSNQVVDASEAMGFYEKAARLANVTNAESKDVVNAMSSAMNSYGMAAGEADRVQDTLFKTIELGRIRMSELGDSVGRVLPLASQMGVSFEEAMASLAVMTRQGVKASTASTQLRAVLQKLLRPSDRLKEIYKEWGVESGPQAIKTFGGLRGVLAKLRQETNGSEAAMGEVFQRVRATTAAMALGVDEGAEFADTFNAIGGAAGIAAEKVAEYQETAEFKFTQAQQELENSWTQLGKNLIPAANYALKLLNNDIEGAKLLVGALTGKFDETYGAAKQVDQIQKDISAEIEEGNKNFRVPLADDLESSLTNVSEFYAEINKYEMRLRETRDKSIELADKSYKKATDKILKYYEDSIKGLENFVKKSVDLIKKANDEIAKIQQDIDDEILENKLDNASNYAQQMQIIEREIAQQRRKVQESTKGVNADESTRDAAIADAQRLKSLIDQAKQLAAGAKQEFMKRKYQDEGVKALEQQQKIQERYKEAVAEGVHFAEQEIEKRKQGERDLQRLMSERKKLLDELKEIDPTEDKDAAKRIGDELKNVDAEIGKIFADGKAGAAFLQSLGLDDTFATVSQGFQEALDTATFDWAREVDRAQAEFDKKVFKIKAAIDPVGRIEQTGQALGIDQGDQSTAEYALKVGEAATEAVRERATALHEIENSMKRVASYETQIQKLAKGIATATQKDAEANARRVRQSIAMTGESRYLGKEMRQAEESAQRQADSVRSVTTALSEAADYVHDGKTLTEEQLQSHTDSVNKLIQGKQVRGQDADELQRALGLLTRMNAEQERLNQRAKELPNRDAVTEAQKLQQQLEYQEKEIQDIGGAQEAATQKMREGAQKTNEAAQSSGQLKGNMQGAGDGAVKTSDGVAQTAGALPGTIALANQLESAFNAAAAAAREMAAAAAAGGGAVAYHGGPMARFFAAGGQMSRGQDKILTSLSAGETVVSARNSKRFFSELNAMNQGSQPAYREQGGPVTNVGDVNVSVNGGDSSQQTVREIAHALRREIQRGNIKLR